MLRQPVGLHRLDRRRRGRSRRGLGGGLGVSKKLEVPAPRLSYISLARASGVRRANLPADLPTGARNWRAPEHYTEAMSGSDVPSST